MNSEPWPDVTQLVEGARVVRIPLRTRFRGITYREAMLLRGPLGWGEWAPFVEYPPAEAARWLNAAVEAAWCGWPTPVRQRVPVNATIPAVAPDQVASLWARFDGCTAVKVKVAQAGQCLSQDVDRIAAVREVVGQGVHIRVDANGGWSYPEAVRAITALARYQLEYVEQPCLRVDDLARVRVSLAAAGVDVLIAADESIRKAQDPLAVARAQAADLIVVKVAPLGGVRSARQIVAQVGLPAVVSSALDTSVGIRAGVALAACLPQLPYACGLGTVELLAGDVATSPLVPRAGALGVGEVSVDEELLDRFAAPAQRVSWWRARLEQAYACVR